MAEELAATPVRVDIRIDGKVRFSNNCYGLRLEHDEDGGTIHVYGSLFPKLTEPVVREPVRAHNLDELPEPEREVLPEPQKQAAQRIKQDVKKARAAKGDG